MLYGERQVRDNIRNQKGMRVFYLAAGDQLTSGARDFLTKERIQILPARQARAERLQALDGGYYDQKPEDMTHLNGDVLVKKTHRRILFRGKMDSFQADLLLAVKHAPEVRKELQEILTFSHGLIRDEVLDQPIEAKTLCGMDEAEIRRVSHYPQNTFGIPHFMPSGEDGEDILYLNRARCSAREAELCAVEAFSDRDGNVTRVDLIQALNRMSSMLYILMIKRKAVEECG